MKTNFQEQLENDITTLIGLLTSDKLLPARDVLTKVPAILRKWFEDDQLNTLAKELEVTLDFPMLDTKPVFIEIASKPIAFFLAGGMSIGDYAIEGTHVSTQESNDSLSKLSEMNTVFLNPDNLYHSERVYFEGNAFTAQQIILFVADKYAEIDSGDDNKEWEIELEAANDYCVFGNPNNEREVKRVELTDQSHGKFMITLPSVGEEVWGCLEIELLAIAQAFVNIHCEGESILKLD